MCDTCGCRSKEEKETCEECGKPMDKCVCEE